VAVGTWVGKGPIYHMTNIYAREMTPGRVIMRAIIFSLIGVVFLRPRGTGLHT
jgi:hypothetical protein